MAADIFPLVYAEPMLTVRRNEEARPLERAKQRQLRDQDSNLNYLGQNQAGYHYPIPQRGSSIASARTAAPFSRPPSAAK
jgi:hypothetical protein